METTAPTPVATEAIEAAMLATSVRKVPRLKDWFCSACI
jgi:hypothetical protein